MSLNEKFATELKSFLDRYNIIRKSQKLTSYIMELIGEVLIDYINETYEEQYLQDNHLSLKISEYMFNNWPLSFNETFNNLVDKNTTVKITRLIRRSVSNVVGTNLKIPTISTMMFRGLAYGDKKERKSVMKTFVDDIYANNKRLKRKKITKNAKRKKRKKLKINKMDDQPTSLDPETKKRSKAYFNELQTFKKFSKSVNKNLSQSHNLVIMDDDPWFLTRDSNPPEAIAAHHDFDKDSVIKNMKMSEDYIDPIDVYMQSGLW